MNMKATGNLLLAALAAAGLTGVAADARADRGQGGGMRSGASHGGGHWRGGHLGYAGYGRHWGGGWGYRSRWYGPRVGFYFGVPVVLGLGYWGSPFWDYPRETVVYREVIRDREVFRDSEDGDGLRDAPAPEPRSSAPAPSSGPLYMNYCESAREYYPKVRSCPEGWKFITPTS
jgi:hypothetical protein